jgi:hypothetical protein
MAHGFEITQKRDRIVIDTLANILGIKSIAKKTYFTAKATNVREISSIIEYYHNTMKGMKSLEYRL